MAPVRKFSCILFLFLMGLNTIGYYSFLVVVKDQVTQRVIEKIQSGINTPGGDMIIKIPVTFPSAASSSEYESISGEISYDQSIYQLVAQRVYKDTLYVVCVRDQKGTEVNNSIREYSATFSNDGKQQGTGIKLVTASASYYVIISLSVIEANAGWSRHSSFADVSDGYAFVTDKNIFRPPRVIC